MRTENVKLSKANNAFAERQLDNYLPTLLVLKLVADVDKLGEYAKITGQNQ